MNHTNSSEVTVIRKEAGELKSTQAYHDSLIEISTDRSKSGSMVIGLIKAELEGKYNELEVDFEFDLKLRPKNSKNRWTEYESAPKLILKFYNKRSYNKFKLVEGLIGKD